MDKNKYIDKKLYQLEEKVNEYLLNNNINQTLAKRMGARFTSTYNENYLWNQALFLSTNSCKVLLDRADDKTALKAIHLAAQIYENLYYIAEKYDRDYCLLLSGFCYDIAGYQANSMCLIKDIYLLEDNDKYQVKYENYILMLIQLLLQKKIQLLLSKTNEFLIKLAEDEDIDIDYKEGIKYFLLGMRSISLFVLHGKEKEIMRCLELSESIFYKQGMMLVYNYGHKIRFSIY